MTILLPRYRENTDEVVASMVDRAIFLAEDRPRIFDEVFVGSPGEVVFYRITPSKAFIWLAQLEEEGYYDAPPWDEDLDEFECLTDAYEEALV